ncbi:MAG: metal-dependent transcriptional regulator [Methanomassiliicoccales archaeon]
MRRTTVEQYLKVIDSMEGEPVRTSRIAEEMNLSPATVSETCKKLAKEGYLERSPYHGVSLTDEGKRMARRVRRRYRILVDFLCMLGADRDSAFREACRIEHEVSEDSIERLKILLDNLEEG